MAEGLTQEGIGERLYLAPSTVKQHRSSLFRAVGAKNAPHAVAILAAHGYIDLSNLGSKMVDTKTQ